jgi:positive regulator of sigma E activity
MKPTIPDTGTVLRLEGGNAVIRMRNDGSCRKCGAATIGLCKGGMMQVLTASNATRARVGDLVKIGLVQGVQLKGYLLAYVIPTAALVLGAAAGRILGDYAGSHSLDVIAGFFSLIAASLLSFRRLKRLDSSSSIKIVNVLSDSRDTGQPVSEEEAVSDHYLSYYEKYESGIEKAIK